MTTGFPRTSVSPSALEGTVSIRATTTQARTAARIRAGRFRDLALDSIPDAGGPSRELFEHHARVRHVADRRPPVVLLPGAFGQELVYWNVWEHFLERDGFHVYPATFPRFTLSDHRASAKLLAQK